jgi:hypothetical protein
MGGRTRRRTCVHERARMRARALHTLGRAARRGRTVRVGTHVFWHTCPLACLHACTRAHLRIVHVYSLYTCSLAHLHSCTLAHVYTAYKVYEDTYTSPSTPCTPCARRSGALHGCNLPFVVRGCDTRVTSPPSPHRVSHPLPSPRRVSPPLPSPHLASTLVTSPRLASPRVMSPRRVSRPPQVRVRGAINDPTVKDEGWSVVCR